jgi:hypothetical protein
MGKTDKQMILLQKSLRQQQHHKIIITTLEDVLTNLKHAGNVRTTTFLWNFAS